VVIRLQQLRGLEQSEDGVLLAEAGVTHRAVSRLCAERGLAGLEFAVGIPGSVGGWVRMNAGIPEREMRDVVTTIELIDPANGEQRVLRGADADWQYRSLDVGAEIVLGASFAVTSDEPGAVRERQNALLERRRESQPVDELSCGSVFKNPPGERAGRLIEAAGLKGSALGGACISEVHANFIVNRGGARAADVLGLIDRAREAVRAASGIELETEVHIVGEPA
jgi:UDP-N-acetylmuramate dehydrogenase